MIKRTLLRSKSKHFWLNSLWRSWWMACHHIKRVWKYIIICVQNISLSKMFLRIAELSSRFHLITIWPSSIQDSSIVSFSWSKLRTSWRCIRRWSARRRPFSSSAKTLLSSFRFQRRWLASSTHLSGACLSFRSSCLILSIPAMICLSSWTTCNPLSLVFTGQRTRMLSTKLKTRPKNATTSSWLNW